MPPLEPIDDVDLEDDAAYRRSEFPKAFFIERKAGGDSTNWWFANTACVRAMLRSAGFVRSHQVSPDTYVCEAPSDPASVPTYGTLWP